MQRCMFIHSGGRRSCHIQHTFFIFSNPFFSFLFQSAGIFSLKREPSWCSLDWKRRRETHPVRIDTRLCRCRRRTRDQWGVCCPFRTVTRESETGPLTGFENVGLLILSAAGHLHWQWPFLLSSFLHQSPAGFSLISIWWESSPIPLSLAEIVIQCSIKRDSFPSSLVKRDRSRRISLPDPDKSFLCFKTLKE